MSKLVFFLLTLFCCASNAATPSWVIVGANNFVDVNNIKRMPNGSVSFWWKEISDKSQPVAGSFPQKFYKVTVSKGVVFCAYDTFSFNYEVMYAEPDMQEVVWAGNISSAYTPIVPGSMMEIAAEDLFCSSKAKPNVKPAAKNPIPDVPNYLKPIDPQAKNRQAPV